MISGQPRGWPGEGEEPGRDAAAAVSSRRDELVALHAEARACVACSLHASRTQAVPGAGPSTAEVMVIGEAPGFNEDRQGRPFVGPAGKLLDTLLAGIGLDRRSVYITNVLKCRPPQNRDPMPSEVEACSPFLARQLDIIRPRIVLLLGRHALERVLPGQGPISRVHGSVIEREAVAYMPLYHPAAALHNPTLVNELQSDFDNVQAYLERQRAQEVAAAAAAAPVDENTEPGREESQQLTLL